MKTFHVGGLNPINRCKTLSDAIEKAKDDDIIQIHKTIKETVTIKKNVIIKGNNNKFVVESGTLGINAQNKLTISDLKFIVESRANAIVTEFDIDLNNIEINVKGPIREFYPVLYLKKGHSRIRNSALMNAYISEECHINLENVKFNTYYGGNIHISDNSEFSTILGESTFIDCDVSHCEIENAHIKNSILGPFTHLSDCKLENIEIKQIEQDSFIKLKKEPESGPLSKQSNNKYCLYLTNQITLKNYSIELENDNYLPIYGDCVSLEIENSKIKGRYTNKLVNSNFKAVDTTDENNWHLEKTKLSQIRSTIKSNIQEETALEKLDKLIGQNTVKQKIRSIINTIKMNSTSNDENFSFSYHMIFAGDPGTGKTTIAKIVAEALFEIGAIPENKCTEATVDSLIKGYVGQTAENTRKILDNALGGVLFIDEAYQLTVKEGQNTFNDEALSVLIRYMEEHRKDLVVIAAGYSKEMKEFLGSNIGLSRRFQWVEFEDYTPQDMTNIFSLMMKSANMELDDPKLINGLPNLFEKVIALNLRTPDINGRVTNGGNGGLVRNVYQKIITARNNRVVETKSDNRKITKNDILDGFKEEILGIKNRQL